MQPVYVQSTGETSYPLLQKVLVAFGDKIAFEPRSTRRSTSCSAATRERRPVTPASRRRRTPPGTETPPGTGTPTTPTTPTSNTALQSALQDAAQAMKDREAAYAANDLVAAAQADERLQKALEAALAADK